MALAEAAAPADRRADAPRPNPILVQPRVHVNVALAGAHLALQGVQLFVLPLALLPRSPLWALLLIPLAAANNPLWSLIHETIYGSFSRNATINRLAGRALAIAFGSPLRVLTVATSTTASTALRSTGRRCSIRRTGRAPAPRSATITSC